MKKTPIYETHIRLGARMTDFGGWTMPVQYSGILEEHRMVRESAGLFDVSHMGEVLIEGKDALAYADHLVTNDLVSMKHGDVAYSPMCYGDGGCVDDVLVYCMGNEKVLLVVNASNTEKDFDWILENRGGYDAGVSDHSPFYSQLAVQGPNAQEILQEITETDLSEIGFFKFREGVMTSGAMALLSRTGYTGEDGFEIYVDSERGEELFNAILDSGGKDIVPCGLGSRDTLRFESCLPLYGHELGPEISPLQAGLGYFVKLNGNDFIGRAALEKEKREKPGRYLVGFEMTEKGIARNGYRVYDETGRDIGFVTSGSFCPTLGKNMGLALVERKYSHKGTIIMIGVRKKMVEAVTVEKPFYSKKYKKREES